MFTMIIVENLSQEDRQRRAGRFAPSPTGRMHLGNIYTAVLSWLSARKSGAEWVLRIEDLDPQRSRYEYARLIEDDLHWLGLDWDRGGLDDSGPGGPYCQSRRGEIYEEYLGRLRRRGLTYACRCTRADIMATQAPHQSDGRVVYAGTCRPAEVPPFDEDSDPSPHATRLYVPDVPIVFDDRVYGRHEVSPARHCGDFLLRRADGAWAYQLAVVVDDALMGVTEVVRGCDLLLSAVQQLYLYELLELEPPVFAHVPLVCNTAGVRLSKRDSALGMDVLRGSLTAPEILGRVAVLANLIPAYRPCTADELLDRFDWSLIRPVETVTACF